MKLFQVTSISIPTCTTLSFWPDCKAIPAYGLMMSVCHPHWLFFVIKFWTNFRQNIRYLLPEFHLNPCSNFREVENVKVCNGYWKVSDHNSSQQSYVIDSLTSAYFILHFKYLLTCIILMYTFSVFEITISWCLYNFIFNRWHIFANVFFKCHVHKNVWFISHLARSNISAWHNNRFLKDIKRQGFLFLNEIKFLLLQSLKH